MTVNSLLYLASLANYTRTYILLTSFDLISHHTSVKIMSEVLGESLAALLFILLFRCELWVTLFGLPPYLCLLSFTNSLLPPDSLIHLAHSLVTFD